MNLKSLASILALAATTVSVPFAGVANAAHSKKAAAKPAALICPVTGNKIASVKDAAGSEVYKGKKYFFCCSECQPRFDKNRAGIVKHAKMGKFEKM